MDKITPLDKQVMEDDTITIAEVRQFIIDAREKRQDFLLIADRSWNEIEKRNKRGRLYGGNDLDRFRRWAKFPLWWSAWKIRQPITLARLPIPVLRDTQGDDPIGRSACVIGERFMRSILKTFDALPEFSSCNDDFLITNFGWGRVFYRKEEMIEEEKIRLEQAQPPMPPPQMDENGQPIPPPEMPPIFINPITGEQVVEGILEDENGAYILSGQDISVENEEVYFESGLYGNMYVDPDALRWNKVSRVAFEQAYSYREFQQKFGKAALEKLAQGDLREHKEGKPIIVFEYWDKFLKECRWFAENSEDFFQPVDMQPNTEELEEVKVDNSELYGLSGFFPCAPPLQINNSTKSFWPTPEYFQVNDILDDIHTIVGRIVLLTKAIRVRFLFDSSVRELQSLIGETGEGGALGVPNLEQSLMNGKGTLANLVAYFPVQEMIQGLENMYKAFAQRLDMFYQVTGISDLIRGQTNPDSDKTFGERQMEGKFALNRIEPFQRKIQEWIKDNYQLLMELGLKMFSDKTIDEYITPQTLDPEDKQRYLAALELLKSNKRRRFRVDFETDSTIQVNQEWRKKQAIETANAITKMMESVAKVAETQPELAATELKIMEHTVGELADGKLFIDEIKDSIQQVIDKVSQPKPPEPNIDEMKLQLEGQKLQFEAQKFASESQLKQQELSATAQLEQLKLNATQQLEIAKLQQQERFEAIANQLEQIRIGNETGVKTAELNQKAQELQAEIALAQEELISKRNEFLLEAKDIANKKEMAQLQLLMDARVEEQKKQLEELYFGLEKQKALLSEREKWVTEMRLQDEHKLDTLASIVDVKKTLHEMKNTPINVTVQAPEKKKSRKAKILRSPEGLATDIEFMDE